MTLDQITKQGIEPALALLPAAMRSKEALVLMLAIGLQESEFEHRRQMGNGPAKSFWQGEIGGGMVHGVRLHPATATLAKRLYAARGVEADDRRIWNAIEHDDVLAAGLARLLIFSDPRPVPGVRDTMAAWDYYERNWRPGKPHPSKWPTNHAKAVDFVMGYWGAK